MGIPILAGRGVTSADGPATPLVVVINETMARRFWSGENPVGQYITLLAGGDRERPREIVGVVADTKHLSLAEPSQPMFYRPQPQPPFSYGMTLVIRGQSDVAGLATPLRHELREIDARLPLYNVRTLDEVRDRAIAAPRFRSLVLSLFASVGVALALIGVYGVVAYVAAQRTREIGIRLALGAQRRSVVRLLLREALVPVALGLMGGLLLAIAAGRMLSTLVFGVSVFDMTTFAAVPLLVLAVALVASWIPALRVARVDPVSAIRRE